MKLFKIIAFFFLLCYLKAQEECLNGGRLIENKCICPIGYKGQTCLDIDCGDRGTYSNKTQSCVCNDGWNGIKCNMCYFDKACGDDSICLVNAPITHLYKTNALCQVVENDVSKIFGSAIEIVYDSFKSAGVNNSAINLYGWFGFGMEDVKHVQTLYCSLSNCTSSSNKQMKEGHLTDSMSCFNTVCKCYSDSTPSSTCNVYVKKMIESINGKSDILCLVNNGETSACKLSFSSLSWKMSLNCDNSICVKKSASGINPNNGVESLSFLSWTHEKFMQWRIYLLVLVITLIITTVFLLIYETYEWITLRRFLSDCKSIQNYGLKLRLCLENYYISNLPWIFKYIPRVRRSQILGKAVFEVVKKKDSGEFHFIVGNSGAGKTSILRCLTGVLDWGFKYGRVEINGTDYNKSNVGAVVSVVYDKTFFKAGLKLIDILKFTANVKGRSKVPESELLCLMKTFNILHLKDKVVGTHKKASVSSGEYKRITIANALVSNPMILIIDEPTNGQDSKNAKKIIDALNNYARERKAMVIVVAHGLTEEMYKLFDSVTVVINNTILHSGDKTSTLDFVKSNLKCTPSKNTPYDDLIKAINWKELELKSSHSEDELTLISDTDSVSDGKITINDGGLATSKLAEEDDTIKTNISYDSKENIEVIKVSPDDEHVYASEDDFIPFKLGKKYPTTNMNQFICLVKREIKLVLSESKFIVLNYAAYCVCGFLIGILAHNIKNDISGSQTRIGVIAMMILIVSIFSTTSAWFLNNELDIMIYETDTRMYSYHAYLAAKIFVDLLLFKLPPVTLFSVSIYISMGVIWSNWWIFLYKCFIFCIEFICISIISSCISAGLSVLLVAPHVSSIVSNAVFILFTVTNGVFINKMIVRDFLGPLYVLNYMKYAAEALYINEFVNTTVIINPPDFNNITIPVDGRFYLDAMGLATDAFELDVFSTISFSFVSFFALVFVFSFAVCVRKKK